MKKSTLITPLIALAVFSTPNLVKAQSVNLFDGKTLNGWNRIAGKADYKVENGVIVGTTVINSGNSFFGDKKSIS